jgi:flagellar basal body P-ring protein FlgI
MWKAQMLAAAGDFSGYRALGYSDEQIAALSGEAESNAETEGTSEYGLLTSIKINQEKGIYRWNGKRYDSLSSMEAAINEIGLTDEEIAQLNQNAAKYGLLFEPER